MTRARALHHGSTEFVHVSGMQRWSSTFNGAQSWGTTPQQQSLRTREVHGGCQNARGIHRQRVTQTLLYKPGH